MLPTTTELTPEVINELTRAGIIPQGTPPAQVAIFARICQEKGISPAQKHIYLLKYNSKGGARYQVIMGIDGFRVIAGASGVHAGTETTYNGGKTIDQCIQDKEGPRTAMCTVKKVVAGIVCEFKHEVYWHEFKGSGKWQTMGFQMLGKCAEAFALKKAFPEKLSGLHIAEEKAAFDGTNRTQAQDNQQKPEIDQDTLYQKYAEQVNQCQTRSELSANASLIISNARAAGLDNLEELKQFMQQMIKELK